MAVRKLGVRDWIELVRPKRRKPKQMHVPWVEVYLGRLSGATLVFLGRRALKRGDLHEFNHCSAVIAVGNTDGDHSRCPLDVDIPMSPSMALRTVVQNDWEGSR
jgi:hypothetical protein